MEPSGQGKVKAQTTAQSVLLCQFAAQSWVDGGSPITAGSPLEDSVYCEIPILAHVRSGFATKDVIKGRR